MRDQDIIDSAERSETAKQETERMRIAARERVAVAFFRSPIIYLAAALAAIVTVSNCSFHKAEELRKAHEACAEAADPARCAMAICLSNSVTPEGRAGCVRGVH